MFTVCLTSSSASGLHRFKQPRTLLFLGTYLAVYEKSSEHTGRAGWWLSSRSGTFPPPFCRPQAPREGSHRSNTRGGWRLIKQEIEEHYSIYKEWQNNPENCSKHIGDYSNVRLCKAPCSLLFVLLSGQLASTSSATQVRLFLPCKRMVLSKRERSKARLVSSPTSLQGGILENISRYSLGSYRLKRTIHRKACRFVLLEQSYCVTTAVSFHLDSLIWNPHVGQLLTREKKTGKHVGSARNSKSWIQRYKTGSKDCRRLTDLCSEADKRHVGVAHGYKMSQLFVESTHFSRPLGLLRLWLSLISSNLQGRRKRTRC